MPDGIDFQKSRSDVRSVEKKQTHNSGNHVVMQD